MPSTGMPQIILTYLTLFKWKMFARCCFILRQNESAFGNLKCFSEVKEPLCSAVPRVELQNNICYVQTLYLKILPLTAAKPVPEPFAYKLRPCC